ncbi:MAG: InlB B-repeat-containing protein, partial [Oscillospiraceae bacterium]|nr:InlB B-repeat-containing protein [Oscillospiraceae bacterium]
MKTLKKTLSLLLAIALVFSTTYSTLAAESDPITETDGETVTVFVPTVSFSESDAAQTGTLLFCIDKNIQVGSFGVNFSESSDKLTLSASSSDAFPGATATALTINAGDAYGKYLTFNSEADGYVLFQVPFTLSANAPAGDYPVSFAVEDLSDADTGDGYLLTANTLTATITVTEAPATPDEPGFSVYYLLPDTMTDSDADDYDEVTPGGTFMADVYVSADTAGQTLEAFEIYPIADENLSWTAVEGIGYEAVKQDSYFAFYNTNPNSPKKIDISTEGTKVATLTFAVSDNAVYDVPMPIWFGEDTNLAIRYTAENATITSIDTTGTEETTVGVETLATVTVTFKGNGSTSGSMSAQSVPYNKATTLTANTFAREDYNFLGWSEDASATAQTYGDQASVTLKVPLTLYAVWNQTHAAYTVEHWQQNAEDDEYTKVDADTETKKGEIGQKTEATAKTYLGFTAKAITQQTIAASGTVVKVYYDRDTYTVTYEYQTPIPAGAPSAPTEVAQRFGKLVQVQSKPTMTGYTLGDWSSQDVPVSDGKFTMPAQAVTLQAAWRANQYTVTLDPTDKGALPEGESDTITVTYNDTWPTLPDPTPNNGYAFDGWYNGDV